MSQRELLATCAAFRVGADDDSLAAITRFALRELAQRVLFLTERLEQVKLRLKRITEHIAPALTALKGVGPDVASTLLLAAGAGIPLGVMAGMRQGSRLDAAVLGTTLVGVSVPIFWLGLMLLVLFAAGLDWLPTGGVMPIGQEPPRVTGMSIPDSILAGSPALLRLAVLPLVLPAVTLALPAASVLARVTRSGLVEVIGQDYIRTARAKGLGWPRVVGYHATRNGLIVVLTIVGLQFGSLMAGSVIVETVFARPGLGSLAVNAIQARDYPVIQGTVLVFASFYVLINLAIDILYGLVNPRIRVS